MVIDIAKMIDDVIKKKVEALSTEDLLSIQKYNICKENLENMITPRSSEWIRGYAFRHLEGKFIKIFNRDSELKNSKTAAIEVNIPKCWFSKTSYESEITVLGYVLEDLSSVFTNYSFTGEIFPNKQYQKFTVNIINNNILDTASTEEVTSAKNKQAENNQIDAIRLIYRQSTFKEIVEEKDSLYSLKDTIKYHIYKYISKDDFTVRSWYNKNKGEYEFHLLISNADADTIGEMFINFPTLIDLDGIGVFALECATHEDDE